MMTFKAGVKLPRPIYLEPFTKEPRHGHWNWSMLGWTCSECGWLLKRGYGDHEIKVPYTFCPSCKAKMDEKEGE